MKRIDLPFVITKYRFICKKALIRASDAFGQDHLNAVAQAIGDDNDLISNLPAEMVVEFLLLTPQERKAVGHALESMPFGAGRKAIIVPKLLKLGLFPGIRGLKFWIILPIAKLAIVFWKFLTGYEPT